MDGARIRKQVYELGPEDLDAAPIWEFALDEEGDPDQDEATVKPRPDLDRADPRQGMLIVRAEFITADGTRFDGYVTPQHEAASFSTHPTIVTAGGQVGFWLGGFPPSPGRLEHAYAMLGKTASELFPIRYRALVPYEGVPLEGVLDGFMHKESPGGEDVVTLT